MKHDVTRKVKKKYFDEFTNSLLKSLGLPKDELNHVANKLQALEHDNHNSFKMLEIKYEENTWNSLYGVLAVLRSSDGEFYTIGYATHRLELRITGTTSDENKLPKMTPKDIRNIENVYCRHKALEALRDEGIIAQINYTP